MAKQYPFEAVVQLRLYGKSPDDVQVALREAYEHLSTNARTGQAGNDDRAYSFSVHSPTTNDDRPAPAIPPKV